MNDSTSAVCSPPSPVCPPVLPPWPVVYALALALRIRAGFGEVLTSITRIIEHAREQIRRQEQLSAAVRAIDDPLERELATIRECLANDPAPKRRRILAALAETHHLTELRAAQAAPRCPEHLLQDT